jgi:hypothetical protein
MRARNNTVAASNKGGVLSSYLATKSRKSKILGAIAIVAILSYSGSIIELNKIRAIFGIHRNRQLSINLGNGNCKWTPPNYNVPEDVTYTKTLIAGFPSGDKRLTYVQMEALTGLSARDEWDFKFLVSLMRLIHVNPLINNRNRTYLHVLF